MKSNEASKKFIMMLNYAVRFLTFRIHSSKKLT
jgi:SOS response regulatory protein OraA/RecX